MYGSCRPIHHTYPWYYIICDKRYYIIGNYYIISCNSTRRRRWTWCGSSPVWRMCAWQSGGGTWQPPGGHGRSTRNHQRQSSLSDAPVPHSQQPYYFDPGSSGVAGIWFNRGGSKKLGLNENSSLKKMTRNISTEPPLNCSSYCYRL